MDSQTAFDIARSFARVSGITPLLPLFFLFFRRQLLTSTKLRSIGHLIIFYGLMAVFFKVTSRLGIVSTPVGHIYSIFEFCLLAFFFRNTILSPGVRKLLVIEITLMVAFGLLNGQYVQGWYSENSFFKGTSNVLIILNCLYFFYEILKNPTFNDIQRNPLFWSYLTIMIYFSGNLFLYLLRDPVGLNKESPLFLTYWITNSMIIVIKDIMFVITLLFVKPAHLE